MAAAQMDETHFMEAFGSQWVGIPRSRADKDRSVPGFSATAFAGEQTVMASTRVAEDWAAAAAAAAAHRHHDAQEPCWVDMPGLGAASSGVAMPGMGKHHAEELCSQLSSMYSRTYNPQEAYTCLPYQDSEEIPVLLGSPGPAGSLLGEGKKDEEHVGTWASTCVSTGAPGLVASPPESRRNSFSGAASSERARLEQEVQELKLRLQQEKAKTADATAEARCLHAALKETTKLVDIQPDRLRAAVQHVVDIGWSNITWRRQYTALHLAAECGNADVLPLLVRLGADPLAKDSKGRTATDVAAAEEPLSLRRGVGKALGGGQPIRRVRPSRGRHSVQIVRIEKASVAATARR
eukprot:CAMPEP_0115305942 /NCGR_PEP_ID=MMETSP0270-20121206/72303_1 /TAXON_ID=71861 /ORGANISM="Scrippsiella trochoidea, Strain CCMP3099" /LENGTH=350 /DNA_ID=CAMNT_0002724205 /DNA_START=30 /DNA_END=1078 /DNA_ORIENTATION=-